MDNRARLSLALILVAFAVGAVVASGIGAETAGKPAVASGPSATAASAATTGPLEDVATPAERRLWSDRGCATCHGPDAHGTNMGPDVVPVIQLYLARYGDADAAKKALAAYLVDPLNSPRLRTDPATFKNPMPAIEKLFGGKRADADVIAGLLVRLAD